MKFEIRNRWTGDVQFTAEIECAEDAPLSIKVGLAVKWGRKSRADLSGANLSGANLSDAVLSGADLSRADLSRADLYGADLYGADLSGANLSGANLYGAVLSGADLSGANLSDAVLSGADLSRADLSRADLYGADLYGADLSGAVFYGTRGVNTTQIKGIIRLPVGDPRGYDALLYLRGAEPLVLSGCRKLTIAQAREHWGEGYAGDREIGDRYLYALDWLEHVYQGAK